jgi:hypothetical protein
VVRNGPEDAQSTDPNTEITAEEGKWLKEDIKKVKLGRGSRRGISKVVLHWNNAETSPSPMSAS